MVQAGTTGTTEAGPEATTAAVLPLMVGERIVCAANMYAGNILILGARHFDDAMHSMLRQLGIRKAAEVQGFYTNRFRFVNRTEAWKIAVSAQQIIRRVGGDSTNGGTLYSENLY